MVQQVLLQILLIPFSLLYGVAISIRDFFYRKGILKGVEFSLPVISVGNLSIGGTGKTPHIEYLIRLLKDYLNVATLSRGYRRKTRGFLVIQPNLSAEQSGDEPLQFARKFDDVIVTVGEDRAYAIPKLIQKYPETEVVLLDDAFQHLSVKPGLNILLTEFNRPFFKDYLLPSGRLREWRSAYQRANFIVVTKCPPDLSADEKSNFLLQLKPLPHQKVFFSFYDYLQPYYIFNPGTFVELKNDLDVLVISAIAGTNYLLDYLDPKVNSLQVMEFEDHHYFKNHDIARLKELFDSMDSKKKIILTTEKDAMRLELHRDFLTANKLPVFVLPVSVQFHFNEGAAFDQSVKDFLLNFKA